MINIFTKMNFEIKKSIIKNITIPSSLSSEIKKNKNKKLSPKQNKLFDDKSKKEKEFYNYELDQSSENINITTKKVNPKIKFENIFDKNKDYIINQLKKEKSTLEKDINEKNNYIEILKQTINSNFLNKTKFIINEKISKKEKIDLIVDYNNLLSENKNIKKNLILQQLLVNEMKKEIEKLKSEKDKMQLNNNNDINGDKNYEIILREKNDLIKELQNKNMKLISENQKIKEKTDNNNKIINTDFIDTLYSTIKEISLNLDNFNESNNIPIKSDSSNIIKKYLEQINIDNNGNFTIKDKLNTINQFNDFIKEELKMLINYIKDKNEEKNINILFNSENGLNYNNNNNKIKNKFNSSYFKFDERLENSISKYNNRYILSNTDLNLNLNLDNQNNAHNKKILYRNRENKVNLKKKLLEKDSLIFNSNLISQRSQNKNNNLNTKVKELTELINNKKDKNENNNDNNSSLFKQNKKLKIPLPVNKTVNYLSPNEKNEKKIENMHIPFILNFSKINKKPKKSNLSNYSNNDIYKEKEKQKQKKIFKNFEYIKTDINDVNKKFDLEFIKLNEILKNINSTNTLSNSNLTNKSNDNSFKNFNIDKISPKFLKIKTINEVNGLANEVMKPSFLKSNIYLTSNDEKDKDKDNFIFKDIKKLEILNKSKNI